MKRLRSGKPVALLFIACLYGSLLLVSWIVEQSVESVSLNQEHPNAVRLPVFDAEGPVAGDRTTSVVVERWPAVETKPGVLPVIWLHGSPGSGNNFARLAPLIAANGRDNYAPDLPGFGASDSILPDVGSRAHARYVLAMMDELGIERAHVVGWSNGGAVALNMTDIAPDRVASVTMIASVGLQETEGSGSHLFEHGKYLAGLAALTGLQNLTPDFGLFGTARDLGWLWNFQQTDQRDLRPIMENLRTPVLLLHGRHDFLTPHWGAERHHEIMPTSRLVMLNASHFIPFSHTEVAAEILSAHFDRHDTPGVTPLTDYDNRAPLPALGGAASVIDRLGVVVRNAPWWALVIAIGIFARWRPMLAIIVCGMYVGRVDLDIAVAWVGLLAGKLSQRRTPFSVKRWPIGWVTTAVWVFIAVGVVFLLEQSGFSSADHPENNWRVGPDGFTMKFGVLGLLAWLILGSLTMHALSCLPRRRGRQRLLAQLSRAVGFEWWPTWAVYLGVLPVWLGRLARGKNPLAFTAANPGIERGGGFIGESKSSILTGLGDDPRALAFELIAEDGTPADRARRALEALHSRADLGGLPVICKPDTGERGRAVKLAKSEDDVREYFRIVNEPVQIQRFDPGPCEFGVFWVRNTKTHTPFTGTVTGITRKVFFTLEGDGKRTLGQRVLAHRRFRCQASVFAQRHAAKWDTVLEDGETLRLGHAGNHAQGCKFEDGSELITPELLAAFDGMAAAFAGLDGGGLDFSRIDVRAQSEQALQRGEFAVIEINGVTSEPAHMYDPTLPFWKAWGILAQHWRHLYRVADARIADGGKPLGVRAILSMWWTARKRDAIRSD